MEARTKADVQKIESQAKAEAQKLQAEAETEIGRLKAQAASEATRLAVQAETQALAERAQTAEAYAAHPALLRLEELAALRDLARNANARLFVDFQDKLAHNGDK